MLLLTTSRYISSKMYPEARILNELTRCVKLAEKEQLNFGSCKYKTSALIFCEFQDAGTIVFWEEIEK